MRFFRVIAVIVKTTFRPLVGYMQSLCFSRNHKTTSREQQVHKTLSRSYHPWTESFFYSVGQNATWLKLRLQRMRGGQTAEMLAESGKKVERSKVVTYGAEIFFEYFCVYGFAVYLLLNEFRKNIRGSRAERNNMDRLRESIMRLRVKFICTKKALKDYNAMCAKYEVNSVTEKMKFDEGLDSIRFKLAEMEKGISELKKLQDPQSSIRFRPDGFCAQCELTTGSSQLCPEADAEVCLLVRYD